MPLFKKETEEERGGFMVRIWETVSEFFAEGFRKVWTGFTDQISEVIEKTLDVGQTLFYKDKRSNIEEWIADFKERGLMDEDDVKSVVTELNRFPRFKEILGFFYWSFFMKASIKEKLEASMGTLRQSLASKYSPYPPSPSDIIQGAFIAPEKTGEIRDRMKASGLSDSDLDLMFLSRYRLYTEEVVARLFLRGELTEGQMFQRMRELGYTDTRTKELRKLWEVIPSIQDIIYMSGKEAFEPDIIEHIGLDQEFPAGQLEWATKQGISEDWMRKYWNAHWDQPSIQQGYEMLHRQDVDNPGNTIIDMAELDMLFRIVEIPPFWRDKLTKIAYQPYTRVDVRRMHAVGVVSDEELIWAYRDQGYDIEHATKMAEFTVRYNMGAEKELTKGTILQAYNEKAIDATEAKTLLAGLDFPLPLINFTLAFEDYKQEKDFQDDLLDNIRDKYQNNLIEKKDAIAQLNALALPQKQISLLMDKWEIKIYKDRKLPSKTDISKWLLEKIIDDDNFKWRMSQLGYSYDQINHYLAYVKKTKKTA